MLAGEWYLAEDEELTADRRSARLATERLNATRGRSSTSAR